MANYNTFTVTFTGDDGIERWLQQDAHTGPMATGAQYWDANGVGYPHLINEDLARRIMLDPNVGYETVARGNKHWVTKLYQLAPMLSEVHIHDAEMERKYMDAMHFFTDTSPGSIYGIMAKRILDGTELDTDQRIREGIVDAWEQRI